MGNQTVIFHHSILQRENGNVKKLLEPNHIFSPSEKEALIKDILEFRSRLRKAGVPVATYYILSLEEDVIVEKTINCGVDGFKILKVDAVLNGEMVLGQIVRALRPILLESEVTLVPDPHPANWCFDEKGIVRYIDFQPARFKRDNGLKVVGFPQPTGKEYEWSVDRYYSKLGLIRMLRFNAMRAAGPEIHPLLMSIMGKELPEHLFKTMSLELDSLLEGQVRRGELNIHEALEFCDEWRVDDIRELAMLVAGSMKSNTATFLDKVLECSRADFNLSLETRHQRLEEAKELIRQEL
ncbi:MAG: hypothetical protein P4L63_03550 [Candidatus Pacebacteria bacterium]|nr:hypothetical protein [Candidatus Paceibacterota bacterium]